MPARDPRGDPILRDLFEVLAQEQTPMQPSSGLRARLLESVAVESRYEGFVPRVARLLDLSLEASRELLAKIAAVASEPWVDGAPGVRLMHFSAGPALAGAHCGLVHIAAGASFPQHRHVGGEIAIILQGVLIESSGERWAPGDLVARPADSRHSLRNGGSDPLIFVAVVIGGIELGPS